MDVDRRHPETPLPIRLSPGYRLRQADQSGEKLGGDPMSLTDRLSALDLSLIHI